MKHSCRALVLHCIDFRFGKAIKEYLEEKNLLGDCDVVSVAGAAKNIASPKDEGDRDFILGQIATSKRLHDIKEIILMNHTDCGAYGGRNAFDSDEGETLRHREDMKKAQEILLRSFPNLRISMVLARLGASGKVNFEDY